ncbi:XrtA-associated ATPase [Magnetospira thiophila]
MYVEFFGLKGPPFQLTPDPRFFFGSTVHNRAKAYLSYGLTQGEGFIVITGDVGAGKTTLLAHLMSHMDSERYKTGTIVTTRFNADDTLYMTASVFGIPHEGLTKPALLERIQRFLADNLSEGKRTILVVDEAQNLTFDALEELRMLSNLQVGNEVPLQSILVGQPQFRRTIASPDLEQLRQRVIASYHLGPVDAEETKAYVQHRLHAVDWNNDPEITEDAFEAIYERTGGVPRRINVLCSRLLLFGCLEELHKITGEDVQQVAEDLELERDSGFEPDPEPQPEPVATVSNVASLDSEALREQVHAMKELRLRVEAIEDLLDLHDKALRRALRTFSDYLRTLDDEVGKRRKGT